MERICSFWCIFILSIVQIIKGQGRGQVILGQGDNSRFPHAPPQASGSQPPPGPLDLLHKYCESDLELYCSNEARLNSETLVLYCLEHYKARLSDSCQDWLGSTTIGGCNNDAESLCGDKTSMRDIYECLDANKSNLSKACLANFSNRKNGENPWKMVQTHSKQATQAITSMSIAYLLIPLLGSLWAVTKMRSLHKEQLRVLSEITSSATTTTTTTTTTTSSITATAESSRKDHGKDEGKEIEGGGVDESGKEEGEGGGGAGGDKCSPWSVTFLNLSYWVLEVPDWRSPFKVIRKQILRGVSGELNPKSVTAIMGPSGGGKTTLLKLLGGQLHHGEFSGARMLNGQLLKDYEFDHAMRNQGYVSQQDNLLENLTVWQTLTFAALLRMPDAMSTHEKLGRAAKVMMEMGLWSVAHVHVGSGGLVTGVHGGGGGGVWGGLSGGQRRRLSIALELLGNPSVLQLDEPTSGLDSASTLRLVKSLRRMSRLRGTTVVLTIHQPRSEVFSLFDSLILLGTGGYLVYSGPTHQAAHLLSQAPCVSLNLERYDNPGDFIIDVLGLGGTAGMSNSSDDEDDDNENAIPSMELSNQRNVDIDNTLEEGNKRGYKSDSKRGDPDRKSQQKQKQTQQPSLLALTVPHGTAILGKLVSLATSATTRGGDNENMMNMTEMDEDIEDQDHNQDQDEDHVEMTNLQPTDSTTITAASPCDEEEAEESLSLLKGASPPPFIRGGVDSVGDSGTSPQHQHQHQHSHQSLHSAQTEVDETARLMLDLNRHFETSTLYRSLARKLRLGLRKWLSGQRATANGSTTVSAARESPDSNSNKKLVLYRVPSSPLSQVWVLFARRIQLFKPKSRDLLLFLFEIVFVSSIVVLTFSYQVDSQAEKPYQILMLFFMISTYAMILQYLILIPEYMIERGVLQAERSSGILSFGPYIASTMLTEIPRAIMHCTILVTILYAIHPLNPDPINVTFCLVCLMVGVAAWQSLICVCSVATDNIGVAYTISFLALGSGSLFGGLMVRLDKIPHIFRFLYYVSVTAVTQRALVVNDLKCCYITATCQSIAHDIRAGGSGSGSSNGMNAQGPFGPPPDNSNFGPPRPQPGYGPDGGGFGFGSHSSATSSTSSTSLFRHLQLFNSSTPLNSANLCPPGLQITGDGSDEGNLGRLYLSLLGLQLDNPFAGLLFLFWANILFRFIACIILYWREFLRSTLKEVYPKASKRPQRKKSRRP